MNHFCNRTLSRFYFNICGRAKNGKIVSAYIDQQGDAVRSYQPFLLLKHIKLDTPINYRLREKKRMHANIIRYSKLHTTCHFRHPKIRSVCLSVCLPALHPFSFVTLFRLSSSSPSSPLDGWTKRVRERTSCCERLRRETKINEEKASFWPKITYPLVDESAADTLRRSGQRWNTPGTWILPFLPRKLVRRPAVRGPKISVLHQLTLPNQLNNEPIVTFERSAENPALAGASQLVIEPKQNQNPRISSDAENRRE